MNQAQGTAFSVRPRVLAAIVAAVIVTAALVLWLVLRGAPFTGGVKLTDLPAESTATVGFAGQFPAESDPALANPLGIAWDGKSLYVAVSDAGLVREYRDSGAVAGDIVLPKAKGALAVYPASIAVTENGRLVIVDTAANRVIVVPARKAKKARVLFSLGKGKNAPGQPTAVAYAGGQYFVFDATVSGVRVYDSRGRFVRTVGQRLEPKIAFAGGMTIDGGKLYVADTNGGRVVVLNAKTGRQTAVFPDRYDMPRALVLMDKGRMAVADAFGRAIFITDRTGVRLGTIDPEAVPEGGLSSPRGVAWVGERSRLYVTDASLGRVLVYSVRPVTSK